MVNIYNWCEVQDYCPNLDQCYNLISTNMMTLFGELANDHCLTFTV